MPLSPEKKELIHEVTDAAVEKTLTRLGIDTADPIEVQKDMAHLRASREGAEHTRRVVKKAAIPIFVGGCLYALWLGAGDAIQQVLQFPRGK